MSYIRIENFGYSSDEVKFSYATIILLRATSVIIKIRRGLFQNNKQGWDIMKCPKCGNKITQLSTACSSCGENIHRRKEAISTVSSTMSKVEPKCISFISQKRRTAAAFLCMIGGICAVFGLLGINEYPSMFIFSFVAGLHRFYVGKIITGIIYSLTFGLLGIGLAIDLNNIYRKQFTDSAGRSLRK